MTAALIGKVYRISTGYGARSLQPISAALAGKNKNMTK
jgi:hypothetical protein